MEKICLRNTGLSNHGKKKIEWVSCDEDTPQIQKGYKCCSVNVIGLTDTGEEKEVFYNYRDYRWYEWNTGRVCKDIIVKWRSLR